VLQDYQILSDISRNFSFANVMQDFSTTDSGLFGNKTFEIYVILH